MWLKSAEWDASADTGSSSAPGSNISSGVNVWAALDVDVRRHLLTAAGDCLDARFEAGRSSEAERDGAGAAAPVWDYVVRAKEKEKEKEKEVTFAHTANPNPNIRLAANLVASLGRLGARWSELPPSLALAPAIALCTHSGCSENVALSLSGLARMGVLVQGSGPWSAPHPTHRLDDEPETEPEETKGSASVVVTAVPTPAGSTESSGAGSTREMLATSTVLSLMAQLHVLTRRSVPHTPPAPSYGTSIQGAGQATPEESGPRKRIDAAADTNPNPNPNPNPKLGPDDVGTQGGGGMGTFSSSSHLALSLWALGRMRVEWDTLSAEEGSRLLHCLDQRRGALTTHELSWSLWALARMGCSWAALSLTHRARLTEIATAATATATATDGAGAARDVGVLLWALVKMDVPINDLPLELRMRLFDSLRPL